MVMFHYIVQINDLTFTGTADHLQPVNGDTWVEAMSAAYEAPPHFSEKFYHNCVCLVQDEFGIDLNRDLTPDNFLSIYVYLINEFC